MELTVIKKYENKVGHVVAGLNEDGAYVLEVVNNQRNEKSTTVLYDSKEESLEELAELNGCSVQEILEYMVLEDDFEAHKISLEIEEEFLDAEKNVTEGFEPKDGRKLEKGMLVGVHWNSHKDCYSVLAMKSKKTTGLVLGYVDSIELSQVTFKIEEATQKKVREQGTKDRHAFVVGYVVNVGINSLRELKYHKDGLDVEIKYNPFKFDTFVMDIKGEYKKMAGVDSVFMNSHENKPCVMFDSAWNSFTVYND